MKYQKLAQELKGTNTIQSIENWLKIKRARAIYIVHKLREKGYIKTVYLPNKKRVYYISPEYNLGGTTYLDIINKYAPVPLAEGEVYRVYGREICIEEALIYAIKKRTVRYAIASIGLFRKIKNWSLLYKLAKKEGLVREVAALYDVARLYIPKISKMPKRFKNLAMPKKHEKFIYMHDYKIISKDFKSIEKKWKVYIPLNRGDLVDYIYKNNLSRRNKIKKSLREAS